ncbi:MAG: 50S ribosomal protein L11 [Candidatus Micrarchaeota archaeon]|nr:50S ribosomal protein L11 [Candidatus Micrarchaeota archaeon]MDE1823809.1 50S ribosomal protein L11 [Candidatus Micrarchaeota archaeon]MDE1849502.1 50S ribosomal protein L11 [Candidatus Micrarchaeota archaeon]
MAEVTINGLIEGGKATGGAPFGPALGPLGVNVQKIIEEINAKTAAFEGIKIPVKVMVNAATKSYRIEVGSPPTSALILKELGLQKGAKGKEEVAGNITIEQVKKVAKAKELSIYGNSTESKVKQVLGTCKSMNVTVEGTDAREYLRKVASGEIRLQ